MRITSLFLFLSHLAVGFSQNKIVPVNEVKPIRTEDFGFSENSVIRVNDYLNIKKASKGWVFKSNYGKESPAYKFINQERNGIYTVGLDPPYPLHDTEKQYIFDIMKSLHIIESYNFPDIINGRALIGDVSGAISRNGKWAAANIDGTVRTDFIYDSEALNRRTQNGEITSVVLDRYTAAELLSTKDKILRYWDPQNYLLQNKSREYLLTYKSNTHQVAEIFRYVKHLPVESSIFIADNNGKTSFVTIDGKIIYRKRIFPFTNFYKGRCLVQSVPKKSKNNNRTLRNVVKIVNEKFKTVKILEGVGYVDDNVFNRYGQVIVLDHHHDQYAVIDYNGNRIIAVDSENDNIAQHHQGLYEVRSSFSNGLKLLNIYNQNGEKLLSENDIFKYPDLEFREGNDTNYIWNNDNDRPYIILDKENNILKKGF